jgi:sporulation protein YlmC with PRC-barrel domain
MIDQASVPSLMGSTVRDNAGEKIGKVGQVYLDDTTGQPEWVTVRTGLFGTKESFVPLAAARVEGDELIVDIAKARVSDAPKIDEDGHLSEEQETELYAYYGVSQGPFGRQTPTSGSVGEGTYAGTEPGRTGEGYPETDAGADYATGGDPDYARTDRQTGVAPTGVATDYDSTDRRTGVAEAAAAGGTGVAAGDEAGLRRDDTGTPAGDADVARATEGPNRTGDRVGELGGDPTGTPVGDVDVAGAMSGPGYGEDGAPGLAAEAGPDFARGQDVSPTGELSTGDPDFARGSDREAGLPADTDAERAATAGVADAGPVGDADAVTARRRLRRWQVTEESAATPIVDESGGVIGEVRADRVEVTPADEDDLRNR